MSAISSIEWTDRTWNPVRGCSMAKGSETKGCLNCYAAAIAARNLPGMRSPTTGKPYARRTENGPRWTGDVELIPDALDEPLRWKKPQRIFVNSMSDLFHEALPDDAIDCVFAVMALAPRHTFQILTKRPARMRTYFETEPQHRWIDLLMAWAKGNADYLSAYVSVNGWPALNPEIGGDPLDHIWLGVSVENQATADERIPLLLQTPAAVRFVSYEPALGPVDFRPWLRKRLQADYDAIVARFPTMEPPPAHLQRPLDGLDQVIVGGESGPRSRPFDVSWALTVRAACRAAGVAFFYKQGGASHRCAHSAKGGCLECIPPELRVREFPA